MSLIKRCCLVMTIIGWFGSITYGQYGEVSSTLVTVRGFLFINGRYVSSPCEIRCDADSVYVNDIDLAKKGIDLTGDRREKTENSRRRRDDQRNADRGPSNRWKQCATDLYNNLNHWGSVVLLNEQKPIVLTRTGDGVDLLKLLCDRETSTAPYSLDLADRLRRKGHDPAAWQQWIDAFAPTPVFLSIAKEEIQAIDDLAEEAEASSSAFLW